MRLGFFNHARYYSDGFKIVTYSSASRFLKSLEEYGILLASVCASLTRSEELIGESSSGFALEDAVRFFPLPAWRDLENQLRIMPFKWREISHTVKLFVASSDVLWVRGPTPLLELILNEARSQNKPVVVHMAGNIRGLWRSTKHKGQLKRVLVRAVSEVLHRRFRKALHSEAVLATGPELVDLYSGVDKKAVPFVDNLVDLPVSLTPARTNQGRLLFVGRVDHGKGLFVTLKALKRIKDGGRRVSLFIVGNGPIVDILKKEAVALDVEDMIKWRGFVPYGDELDREYKESHALILPSESTEGFPRVILEAWAKGVPVIASNIGGISRIITNGRDGILVPPSDDMALAAAILQLITSDKLRTRIVEGARESLKPWTLRNQSFVAAQTLKEAYNRAYKSPKTFF